MFTDSKIGKTKVACCLWLGILGKYDGRYTITQPPRAVAFGLLNAGSISLAMAAPHSYIRNWPMR